MSPYHAGDVGPLRTAKFSQFFNYTATYRRDSDAPACYIMFKRIENVTSGQEQIEVHDG